VTLRRTYPCAAHNVVFHTYLHLLHHFTDMISSHTASSLLQGLYFEVGQLTSVCIIVLMSCESLGSFQPWIRIQHILPKRRYLSIKPHDVTFQKTVRAWIVTYYTIIFSSSSCLCTCNTWHIYVVRSKSFRPDIQKPRQMENAVRDI
jgi:hypothetical protein